MFEECDENRRNVYLCVYPKVDEYSYSVEQKDLQTTYVALAAKKIYSRWRSFSVNRRPVSCGVRTKMSTVKDRARAAF